MKKIINFCSIFLLIFLINIIGVKAKGEIKIESVTVKDKSSTITVNSPTFICITSCKQIMIFMTGIC